MISTKEHPSPYDGMERALAGEPVFTLIARDPDAPSAVRHWSDTRRTRITSAIVDLGHDPVPEEWKDDLRRCSEADVVADDMERWRKGLPPEEALDHSDEAMRDMLLAEGVGTAMREADYHLTAALEASGKLDRYRADTLIRLGALRQQVHDLAMELQVKRS